MTDISFGDFAATIDEAGGANCIRLENTKYGAHILREPKGKKDNPYLYGMPILYPVNRISGGTFAFEGRTYRFPVNEPETGCHLHGELWKAKFEIAERKENFAKFVYQKAQGMFPHSFRIEMSYELSDCGLKQETTVTNLSDENMPNLLGFHTTFHTPFLQGGSAEDIRIFAEVGGEAERNEKFLPTGRIMEDDKITADFQNGAFCPANEKISRNYKSVGGGAIEILDIKNKISVVYENDVKFGWRLFFNKNAADYICLEPMTCMSNSPNAPFDRKFAGFDFIAPHKSKKYVSKIYLKEL